MSKVPVVGPSSPHVPAPAPTSAVMDDSVDSIMGPMSSTRIDSMDPNVTAGGEQQQPFNMEVWRI